MTRQEAVEYDNELKCKMEQVAEEYSLDAAIGADIVDKYIMILPDDARKGMIFLGNTSSSYKCGNITYNLKKAMVAGLELTSAMNEPENFFNYVQLLIVVIFFIQKSIKIDLNKLEAFVVYYLHKENAYHTGIDEEKFIDNFRVWYHEYTGKMLEVREIQDSINRLYTLKCVDIIEGSVSLKERVAGNM